MAGIAFKKRKLRMKLFQDYEKIRELEQEIESRTSDGEWIFRGESKFNDQVNSSLYRKCIKLPRTNESNVHKTMELVEGRMQVEPGIFSPELHRGLPPPTPNWELYVLIATQHLGFKANLIDFTKEFKIALFFACSVIPSKPARVANPEENGRLIMLRRDDERVREHLIEPEEIISRESSFLEEIKDSLVIEHIKKQYDSARTPISDASEETIQRITSPEYISMAKQSIQAWGRLIPDVTSRVRTQKSILVRHPKGYIPGVKDDPESDDNDVIEVPKSLKKSILSYLSFTYQIMYPTLFSDFWGTLVTQDDIIKSSDGGPQFLEL